MSLYIKHRPQNFDQVVGQDEVVRVLESKLGADALPKVILFAGPTGVGKTTLARILARRLDIKEHSVMEINCAEVRGIDSVREIQEMTRNCPLSGRGRLWILDEVVQLPKTTQQAFLKLLEDTPPRDWFCLCTSDVTGLLPTFLGRCFRLNLKPLDDDSLRKVLAGVQVEESKFVSTAARDVIVEKANGSARMALQLLEAALTEEKVEDQLRAVGSSGGGAEKAGEFLAKALFRKASWGEVQPTLEGIDQKDMEGVRLQTLAYAGKVLLSNRNSQFANLVIQSFRDPWDRMGKAGLIQAVWEVLRPRRGEEGGTL